MDKQKHGMGIGQIIALITATPSSAVGTAMQAKAAAEAAADRAEEAADTVTSASVAETKAYLGIE